MGTAKHALFVAAESGALPGGKVGGVGDVVRELPEALMQAGWTVSVVMPSYGFLHANANAQPAGRLPVGFAGKKETAKLYEVRAAGNGVRHILIEHALLAPAGPGKIYCNDGSERPFATDAGKFAFFCAAVAEWLSADGMTRPDIVHLHDWHSALLLLLRASEPRFQVLRQLRFVYTVHNLALQGIRPLAGDTSSLQNWFPDLQYEAQAVSDPRYPDCINPMALGLRLADKVNTVSPSYAREICLPDDIEHGFYGGAGLEQLTAAAAREGRLVGILNGCMYSRRPQRRGWRPLARALTAWNSGTATAHIPEALRRFRSKRPRTIVTSVGRFTQQKTDLFLQPVATDRTALDAILRRLGDAAVFVMLGSGDALLEQSLEAVCSRHANAVLLQGYDENMADCLYECGDLFLMPSSFEPCGISQMLAMRAGQPCVVHGVGGLRDTVIDGETGFAFHGHTPPEQAQAFVTAFDTALSLRESSPQAWKELCRMAAAQRFSWEAAARAYVDRLYVGEHATAALPAGDDHA